LGPKKSGREELVRVRDFDPVAREVEDGAHVDDELTHEGKDATS
jgi:hypothetical protein